MRVRLLSVSILNVILLFSLSVSVYGNVYNTYYGQAVPISAETPKVILQQGTAGTSTIYTNNTSARVSIISGFSNATKSKAFIAYRSNTGTNLLNSPKNRIWNGTAWSTPETEMATAGSAVLWVRTAFCPNSSRYYERIVVTLSSDDYLDAYVWNGSSWEATNNIGQVNTAAGTYQSFDIAYESTSGKAMLVYSVLSTSTSRDLAYRIWNGTTWSDEAYIDDTGHSSDINYRWVELESNPTSGSNEIALIAIDQTDADCNGWIWNGSAWGNFKELENSLAGVRDNKLMAIAYEQTSGEVMFVWGYNNYMESRKWNGTNWENELPAINIATSANVRWISLKANPTSSQLMAVTIDGGNDLNSEYWNGSAWGSPIEHDDGITHIDRRCADFDWEPSGGKGLLVWSAAQDSVSYKTFAAPSTWSNASTVSNPGGHPWIQLRRNPRNVNGDVKILGATLNSNLDIFGFRWNGSALTFEATDFTTETTMMAYESFEITFRPFGDSLNYDYVLKVVNQAVDPWKIRLRAYDQSNIGRLSNSTIYFNNGGGVSRQIYILNGAYSQQFGNWYDLTGLSTVYIAMTVSATSTGTSYIYGYLEVLVPGISTYNLMVLTFEAS